LTVDASNIFIKKIRNVDRNMSSRAEDSSERTSLQQNSPQEKSQQEDTSRGDADLQERYSREHIMTVLGRVRRSGGIPMEEKTRKHVACWLRGLALRGYIDGKLLGDTNAAKEAFKTFENPTTRAAYARAVVTYIGGLTDEEFTAEYPDVTRNAVVRSMKDIAAEAGKESKGQRGDKV
jgi:hypothetical protein